jgi:Leucine-rich repeat (LRR) protein
MNLRVVKKLDISDNLIKNIDSIGNLIKLEYIDLINNRMIKLLEDKNLIEDLYKDKNKINIYDFLSKVINANDKFNNDVSELDEKKIKQLRIIQSKIIYVFSSHNNYITELICLQHLIK